MLLRRTAQDDQLSTTSTNPVENRVITNALNGKANTSDIPIVPSNVSAFYNDAGYMTSATVAENYYNKSQTYTRSEIEGLVDAVQVPTKTSELTNDGSDGTSTYVEANELATIATSGSYNDASSKPQINGVTLAGDKSFEDLGTDSLSNIDIDNIINSVV